MTAANEFYTIRCGGQISAPGGDSARAKGRKITARVCVTRHDFHTKLPDDLPIYLLRAMCVFVWVGRGVQTSNESNPELI